MGLKDRDGMGLLDWLTAECGCAYLSDLRLAKTAPALARSIKRAPRGRWTDEAWREAAAYITGAREIPAAEDGARELLERWLNQ